MRGFLRALVLSPAFVASVAAPLVAQEAVPPAPILKGMFVVYVLDRSGAETKGSLVSLTHSALVVRTDTGSRTFDLADVVRIHRQGDSLKNGAIIGAVVGAVSGVALAGDCSPSQAGCGGGGRVALVLTGIGVWAAIGAGIDALIPGRTLIWTPNSSTGTGGLTLVLSPKRRSAFVGWTIRTARAGPTR